MWNILCGGLLLFFQLIFIFGKTGVDNIGSLKMNLDLARDLTFKDGGNQKQFEKVGEKGKNL